MEVQNIIVRKYKETDLPQMVRIWNEVVAEGNTFPQTELLDEESARAFFSSQTETAVAQEKNSKELLGLYILHPNNIGRCRTYRKRKLCRFITIPRTSYRRKTCAGLS